MHSTLPSTDEAAHAPLLPWADEFLDSLGRLPAALRPDRWAPKLGEQPCEKTMGLVAAASLVFYRAEKGNNPKVKDIWDALIYCATCISVGYADIFPRTSVGKIIGAWLMTIGPAMAAKTLDGPSRPEPDPVQGQILAALQDILAELRGRST